MAKMKIEGSFVALITPFNQDGSADFEAFRSLLKFQEDNGTKAVLIMGSTGEVSLLSQKEREQIIVETAKMKTGKMKFFYGCTGNNTQTTMDYLRFARANGADGAILAAPAYICGPEADLEDYFLEVADATDLPLGLYNNPPRVKTDLHWDNLLRIFKHPNYVVHKESTTRVGQVAQVGGPDALLDLFQQRAAPAQHEHRLADDEHRADEQAHEVIHEGGLAALVVVADELDHPAQREHAGAPGQPGAGAAVGHAMRGQHQHRGGGAGGQAQRGRAACDPPGGGECEGDPGRRERPSRQRERCARQQHADREHDHRHADEVGGDVAAVAVVGGVLDKQFGGVAHTVSPDLAYPMIVDRMRRA